MPDLAKIWNPSAQAADLVIVGAGFEESPDLTAAAINSLFTDARATPELLAHMGMAADADARGWWGDSYARDRGDRTGSLLWTLAREKQLQETLNRARDYCAEALAWLIADGLAAAVDVEAEWIERGRLGVRVTITLVSGRRAELHFNHVLRAA
jgi:phage gp46-like protein